jgi:hypothetical protein
MAGIGRNCFQEYIHLCRLKFRSLESLNIVVGHRSLDDALYETGVNWGSSLFRIEVEDGGVELNFSGLILMTENECETFRSSTFCNEIKS